jgi:hypothetical protein
MATLATNTAEKLTISLQSKIQINYLAKNQQTKLLGSIGHKTPQSVHGFRTKRSQTNKTLTSYDLLVGVS